MPYELVIVGGGPAALALLNNLPTDLSVLVLEQHPPAFSKLCGGLLTKQAQTEVLRQFGAIPPEIICKPATALNTFVDFNTGLSGYWPNEYLNVDRHKFDQWLLNCVIQRYQQNLQAQPDQDQAKNQSDHNPQPENVLQAGQLRILFGHRFVGFEGNEAGLLRIESIANGQRFEFFSHLLIDASGCFQQTHPRKVHRLFALQALAQINPQPQNYITVFDNDLTPFFGWIIPKNEWCLVGIGLELEYLKEPPRKLFDRFLAKIQTKLKIEIEFNPSHLRASWLTQVRQPYDIDGGQTPILRIGEAAGMISASSGEGLSFALSSGRLLAQALGASIQQGRLYKRKPLVFPYHDFAFQLDELRFNIKKSKSMASVWPRRVAEWGILLHNRFYTRCKKQ